MLKRKILDALTSIRHYCSIHHDCLFLKDMGWKHTAYHIINSDPGHTRSEQQLNKTLKITVANLSRKSDEKGKKKKKKLEWQCKAFCVSRKRNNCNRKVKDFRKLSNEEIYNKPFKSIFLWPKCMEEHHIPSPDIWRKISTDWFIKCSNGYVFCIWYKFIHFLPFKPCNI